MIRQVLVCALACAFILLCVAGGASAEVASCDQVHFLSWAKGGGGDFQDDQSWDPQCKPDATKTVDIGAVSPGADIENVSGTVAGLTAGSGVRLHGSGLTVLASLSLWSSHGTLDTHLDADLHSLGFTTIDGDGDLFVDAGRTLDVNAGAWSGGGNDINPILQLNANAHLNVSGTFTAAGAPKTLEGSRSGTVGINPGGAFVADAPVLVHAAQIESAGTLQAKQGQTLTLDESQTTLSQGASFAGPGLTRITTPTSLVTLAGDAAVSSGTLELSAGVLQGSGQLGGAGRLNWTGGHLDGAFSTGSGLHFDVTGDEPKFIEGTATGSGQLTLKGPSSWGGTGAVHLKTAAVVLRNEGTMRVEPGALISGDACCESGEAHLVNTGTVVTEGDGDRTIEKVPAESSGTIDLK